MKEVGFDYEKDLGDPGEYPYRRGIHPLGYRSRAWTTRQYAGSGTPVETDERFKLMISHGQTGLNVAFDLPTQIGYDSCNSRVVGEVGRVGMAEKYGYRKDRISTTSQNDILIGRGTWIFSIKPFIRLIGDTIEYSMNELPRCSTVSVCGYHIRKSGATPAQEIAFDINIADTYIDNVLEHGYNLRRSELVSLHLKKRGKMLNHTSMMQVLWINR